MKQMDNEKILELQNDAYTNILEKIATEDDPEKLQQLANAAAQLEKGRNDACKIKNDANINQQKLENEEKAREEDKLIADKHSKSDKAWKIFDSALALLGCAAGIMLAFKTILADIDEIDTIVFDEIDTGISGIAAQVVGEKLHNIAKKKQILCITHLPQIAANADTHFCISKNTDGSRTYTTIKKLEDKESINEIARLIAGSNITEMTIEHAREIVSLTKENH